VTDGGLAATVAAAGRGVDHLAEACAADPACNSRYPDLAGSIEAVRSLYNASPWMGTVQIDADSPATAFVITGDDIIAGLFQALYDASLIPLLPSIIVGLQGGDTSILPVFVEQSIPQVVDQADAMSLAFDCADNAGVPDVQARDEAAVAAAGAGDRFSTVVTLGYAPLCDEWGVPPTSPAFNEPVTSDIPTLALAGSFDPITPPAATEAAAAALDRSTFVLFADQGHGVTGRGVCQDEMTLAFLADPTAPVDTSCATLVAGPVWS
jgi:pimeloyl-ACP methyl ester carboxylesterase